MHLAVVETPPACDFWADQPARWRLSASETIPFTIPRSVIELVIVKIKSLCNWQLYYHGSAWIVATCQLNRYRSKSAIHRWKVRQAKFYCFLVGRYFSHIQSLAENYQKGSFRNTYPNMKFVNNLWHKSKGSFARNIFSLTHLLPADERPFLSL